MITPTIKDDVLKWLCLNLETESPSQIPVDDVLKSINIDFDTLNSVLRYFERHGFIEDLNARKVAIFLILRVEANDFLLRGGFVAQEELLEANINKLLLEIDHLKKELGPDRLETVNKLSSIAAAVFSGLSLFSNKF